MKLLVSFSLVRIKSISTTNAKHATAVKTMFPMLRNVVCMDPSFVEFVNATKGSKVIFVSYYMRVLLKCLNLEEHITYSKYSLPKLQGRFCECEEGKQTSNEQCDAGDCRNDGKCFCGKCECKPGFEGDCCQINVNDVKEEFCHVEGTATTCHGMYKS